MSTDQHSRILVAAAVEEELEAFAAEGARRSAGPVRTLVTGVGKISASTSILGALRSEKPRHIVLLGSAGAYSPSDLRVGDVVVASEEILGDEGAEVPGGFLLLEELELPVISARGRSLYNRVPVEVPAAETIDELDRRGGGRYRVRCAPVVTVSTISGTGSRAASLYERWQGHAESMEGAAAAAVAWQAGVPLVEVRGISNMVGDRRREKWELETACRHAASVAWDWMEIVTGSVRWERRDPDPAPATEP